MRMAPGACGEAPEAGGSEEESGRRDGRPLRLLRRLCCQKAESAQLVVGEDDLLAAVAHFQVADASETRKAPNFCHRQAQQDGGMLLPDALFLDI